MGFFEAAMVSGHK